MRRHPFDPVSLALGVVAVIAGLLVALGAVAAGTSGGGWWIAVAVMLLGVVIIPWRRPPAGAPNPPADDA